MKLRNLALATLLVSIGLTRTAVASPGINYNYAEAGYKYVSTDDSEVGDGQGVLARVSWSPLRNFFVEGGYEYLNFGLPGSANIDENAFRYGIGGYYDLQENLDLVGRVGGVHSNLHLDRSGEEIEGETSENEAGVYVGAALRYEVTKEIELEPGIEYTNLEGNATWLYEAKALYALDDAWQLAASAGITNDSDVELIGGVRYNWGCSGM